MDKHKLKQEIIGILCNSDFDPDKITEQINIFKDEAVKRSHENVFKCAAKACGITDEEIFIKSRKDEVVLARFIAWAYLRAKTSLSFASIGGLTKKEHATKGMDHATVHSGINRLKELLETNDKIAIQANIRFYNLITKK